MYHDLRTQIEFNGRTVYNVVILSIICIWVKQIKCVNYGIYPVNIGVLINIIGPIIWCRSWGHEFLADTCKCICLLFSAIK